MASLGSGPLVLTGTNTFSGQTSIASGGTLQLGNGAILGSVSGSIADAGVLAFENNSAQTYAGVISGGGSLAAIGSGPLVLTNTNTFSGGTSIISGGTLQLGNGATLGSVSGSIADAGVLAFNNNSAQTYAGVISGGGSLAAIGSGPLVLTNTNTFSGRRRSSPAARCNSATARR